MSTRKIVGFNDECEFEVINNNIIRVIDNGPSYKNKLKNGLLLDTLCSNYVKYEDVIYEKSIENITENKCVVKINYDIAEMSDEMSSVVVNKMKNKRHQHKNKINNKEKKRRDKRKMLKVGNDYKINQYQNNDETIFNKVIISRNHFGKKEEDKYAELCSNCFIFTMLSKRYYMLYKCSYETICCKHMTCWMCKDKSKYVSTKNSLCSVECYDNSRHLKYVDKCNLRSSRSCNCGEEYGFDYGKKYKCGTYFGFDFNTNINYDHHLDQNGNIIVEIKDENVNLEPILDMNHNLWYDTWYNRWYNRSYNRSYNRLYNRLYDSDDSDDGDKYNDY